MKKIYLKPETSILAVKAESLLTSMSMFGGTTNTQLSNDIDLWDDEDMD